LYALLYHPKTDKVKVATLEQKGAIMPCIEREKQANIKAAVATLERIEMSQPSQHSQHSQHSQPPSQHSEHSQPSQHSQPPSQHSEHSQHSQHSQRADEQQTSAQLWANAEKEHEFYCLSFDGEHSHLVAAMGPVADSNKRKGYKCLQNKLPAGSSPIRALNDVASMHSSIHSYYQRPEFVYHMFHQAPPGGKWRDFLKLLKKKLSPADFESIREMFTHAPAVISKAITRHVIESACRKTGIISLKGVEACEKGESRDPSDPGHIMSVHPDFANLQQADADKVMKVCFPQFVAITSRCGRISEGKKGVIDGCVVFTFCSCSLLFIYLFF
jgi:hypothetical protein